MFNSSTKHIFGGSFEGPGAVGTRTKGTAGVPFEPFIDPRPVYGCMDHYQCITFQSAYQKKSLEELRIEDYARGLRYDISEVDEDLPGNQEAGPDQDTYFADTTFEELMDSLHSSRKDFARFFAPLTESLDARPQSAPSTRTVPSKPGIFSAPSSGLFGTKNVGISFQERVRNQPEQSLLEHRKEAQARVEQIDAELSQVRTKRVADLAKEIDTLKVENADLKIRRRIAELKTDELVKTQKGAQEKLVALSEEVATQKMMISDLERQNAELQSREKDLEELVEEFQADVEVSKVRLGRLLSIESRLGQVRRRISSSKDVSKEDEDFEMMRSLFGEL
ncbi:unnamed protein product [Zymoseptoria tritici ST99CH_1E4]|uniref:Uncharacterized protein n=1 Tax=Zymoseptoria tritici ST99CH_1E4 TaxID=1276532 RepID=A0A2H1G6L0_ZYMTR|nr:unnamed protein product [Zymoseptoria tritici ST99CH_1E4]